MNIMFYNGVSGLMAYQEEMNLISHNVANSGTYGYKPDKAVFSDLLYTRMAVNSEEQPLVGHGVKYADGRMIYKQGPVLQSGCTLDFALMGDGFFCVRRSDGSIQYTRNGAFDISIEGKKGFLVTNDGSHVLDEKGKDIELVRQSDDGLFDLTDLKDRIAIYDFPNPFGLEHANDSCLRESAISGEPVVVVPSKNGKTTFEGRHYQLIQSAVEQSAVDLADEMVGVIMTQKAYQFNAKMVQTADELEQVINNLR